jgi:hypothetical protein
MRITLGQLRRIVKKAVIKEALVASRPGVYEDEDVMVGYDPDAAQDHASQAAQVLMALGDAARHPEMVDKMSVLRSIHRHLADASLAVERALDQPDSDHEDLASRALMHAEQAHQLSLSLLDLSPEVSRLVSHTNALRGSLSMLPEDREDMPTADLGDLHEPL